MNAIDLFQKIFRVLTYIIFCFIIIIIFVNSCVHTKMTHLEKKDLEWIQNANIYTTQKFISDSSNLSSLLITSHSLYNSTNPFREGPWVDGEYEAKGNYGFVITQDNYNIDGLVVLRKSIENDSLYFTVYIDNYHIEQAIPQKTATLNLNGKIFNDCIIFDSKNGSFGIREPTIPNNRIDKFILCKQYGLIYYKLESGEQFFLKSVHY